MNIFRNVNSTLIISIGISALLCGAIVYYCNYRLSHIEYAVMRQNQVLSSFIANVQNEIKGGTRVPVLSEDVSTQEARESAENQVNKIIVSDDDTDDDDDDDDDSSSESETENENENENDDDEVTDDNDDKVKVSENSVDLSDSLIKIIDVKPENDVNNSIHHIKIVDMQDISTMFINEVKFDNRNMTTHPTSSSIYEIKDESSDSDDDSDDEDDNTHNNDNDNDNTSSDITSINQINNDKAEKNNTVKLIKHDINIKEEPMTTETPTQITKNVEQQPLKQEQMRVDDLRKLVLERQLSSKDEVKKLKKPELLFLLQNSN